MERRMKDIMKRLRGNGRPATLLGIGPMSEEVIRASVRTARDFDFPLMLIASRNQVDRQDFGGGYILGGTDQFAFVKLVRQMVMEEGYKGPVFICRDHGGPWQRDEEYRGKLEFAQAMERAKLSYRSDIEAGFNLLHIDPTKDPHVAGALPLNVVLDRVVELIGYTESVRRELGLSAPISYEVGTEETAGGLTGDAAFEAFLHELYNRLEREALPTPDLIVGQTGTLVRMGTNVGRVDGDKARHLEAIARKYGIGLKEHNADYLAENVIAIHPAMGITAANVAPEYGQVQTQAYLELASLEEEMLQTSSVPKSHLSEVIKNEVIASERWRKWLVGEAKSWTVKDLLMHPKELDSLAKGCGHYIYPNAGFRIARDRLYNNLGRISLEMSPEEIVIRTIQVSIERYVSGFNLRNLNSYLVASDLHS